MQKEYKQFSAYILAAEYAWSGQTISPEQLPYQADEVFARAWNPTVGGDVHVLEALSISRRSRISNPRSN